MGYISANQRSYSITLIKELGNETSDGKRIVWLNYPIMANYRYVESLKIGKDLLKSLNNPSKKDQFLKLAEWNLDSYGDEEKIVRCVLCDQGYYLITITLSASNGNFFVKVEKVEEEKHNQGVKISWFKKGDLLVDHKDKLDTLKTFTFELMHREKFHLAVESIKSLPRKKVYNPPPFKKYILYLPIDIEETKIECFENPSKVIANVQTDIYGNSKLVEFLFGKKVYVNVLKDKIKGWGFDCADLPRLQTHRTVFLFVPCCSSLKNPSTRKSGKN